MSKKYANFAHWIIDEEQVKIYLLYSSLQLCFSKQVAVLKNPFLFEIADAWILLELKQQRFSKLSSTPQCTSVNVKWVNYVVHSLFIKCSILAFAGSFLFFLPAMHLLKGGIYYCITPEQFYVNRCLEVCLVNIAIISISNRWRFSAAVCRFC